MIAVSSLRLQVTRKYAYLTRPHRKDKVVARKPQASGIFNFINLTVNRLLIDRQLQGFWNNTKCEVRNIWKPSSGQYKMRTMLRIFFVQHKDLLADDFGHIALNPLLILESTSFVFALYVDCTAFVEVFLGQFG